jgi:hypothetical protein
MDPYEAALNDLISRARGRGSFTIEDLRKAFPVDSMTVEDISQVLARLEQAGFDLEIDPALLLPGQKAAPGGEAPVAKRDETEWPKPMPEGRRQPAKPSDFETRAVGEKRYSTAFRLFSSAAMLPWIVAFAIVTLAVFAAFAL